MTLARWHVVALLGSAQTLAWASSYYLPAMLAPAMARELGLGTPTVFLAFSLALVISAFFGPVSGRTIDRHGGRPVLMGTNLVFAAGLAALGLAQGPVSLFAAWALVGVAMGSGLYEAGFATLVRLYGTQARNPITGITLLAGFASTVGWPLSALMESQFGWRGACFGWAALHLLLGLPLNALLPRPPLEPVGSAGPTAVPAPCGRGAHTAPRAASSQAAPRHSLWMFFSGVHIKEGIHRLGARCRCCTHRECGVDRVNFHTICTNSAFPSLGLLHIKFPDMGCA
ncbi:MAG: MFS transporter [Burkholderiales bacterium]|nr:MFS transporter [Burkholderiales bacterium]